MQRFRGGLVCKAHGLLYLSTLGLRVTKRKKKVGLNMPYSGQYCREIYGYGNGLSGDFSPRILRSEEEVLPLVFGEVLPLFKHELVFEQAPIVIWLRLLRRVLHSAGGD